MAEFSSRRPPVSEELYAFVQPERAGGCLGEKAAAPEARAASGARDRISAGRASILSLGGPAGAALARPPGS